MYNFPTHPIYDALSDQWIKWRYTYEGGDDFIDSYLEKFSIREDDTDFKARKRISYNPAFAAAAIDEVKNSIYQRIIDVNRKGGSNNYQNSIAGKFGGVDLKGNSMDSFMGCQILPELLIMGRVGIFIDMPKINGPTKLDALGARPYLYIYKIEQIKNWTIDSYGRYNSILLEDTIFVYDPETGFPKDTTTRYRFLYKNQMGNITAIITQENSEEEEIHELDLTQIPFVSVELSESLMKNICNYQIALLNLSSSDIFYALKSNFPFYTEQYDPRAISPFIKPSSNPDATSPGAAATEEIAKDQEIRVGTTKGRRYPINTERPAFIAPPSDPLTASMEKQEQLKSEIRLLLNLSLSNLRPSRTSAESKKVDDRSLESGLSYIGMALETAERQVAEIWANYEHTTQIAEITYPKEYTLKTDDERRVEAKELEERKDAIPSLTYKKEISKNIAKIMLSAKIQSTTLDKIYREIDSSEAMTSNAKDIRSDIEIGILDKELASKLRNYPEGTVEKAEEEHLERLQAIAVSQTQGLGAARGVDDMSSEPDEPEEEKEVSQEDPETSEKLVRGESK